MILNAHHALPSITPQQLMQLMLIQFIFCLFMCPTNEAERSEAEFVP
ncbi:MAG: hypothetical protein IJJ58_02590 [Campylobacter sp.]|nr:hypothetical protein [Campylobacter sp.]